jgi:transglutaminase-like putative cysteine protease
MKYRIVHETQYSCSETVSVGHNEARLKPRATPRQTLLNHFLSISPEPSIKSETFDYFGNPIVRFSFNQGYTKLSVNAISEIEIADPTPLPGSGSGSGPSWEEIRLSLSRRHGPAELTASEFVFESPRCRVTPEFADYARQSFTTGRPIIEAATELMGRFHRDFRFDQTATTVTTPVEQVFRQRRGVCQDFAHLFLSLLRSLGLSARYISGYLRTLPPPGKPRLVGADASHAWLSLWCGSALGWIDFDPTTNLLPGRGMDHITIAWGRDYGDIAPLKGVFIGGGQCAMSVGVDVAEINEKQVQNQTQS